MKIYWKNILYNYTIRYYKIVAYYWRGLHRTDWKRYYYVHKKFNTSKEEDVLFEKLSKEAEKLNFQK